MTKTEIQSPKTTYIWIALFVLVIFVYFFGLTIPLLGPDEPRYSQVAREMFMRGDWITPTLGGYNWFEKPALLYWLQIVSYNIFGVSEFAARFGSALFGLGTIFSLWTLGRFSATENTEVNSDLKNSHASSVNSAPSVANDFAKWLALIAASSIGIIVFSRGASFDIILTFPMTAALVCFFIFDSVRKRSSSTAERRLIVSTSLIAFYFFIGISLLAKGLVGIVLPFAIVTFYYFLSRRFPNKTFNLSLFWGTMIALAIALVWYLPMYLRHCYEFIDEFFIQHHFQRFTSNKYFHPQPFYFFFWVLPLMTIPWLPFFLAAIWDLRKIFFQRRDAATQSEPNRLNSNKRDTADSKPQPLRVSASPFLLFALSWLLIPLVFFSFSGSKLPGYILPALPGAILLTAAYIWQFVQKSKIHEIFVQLTAFATFSVIIGLLLFVVPSFAESDSVKGLIAAVNERGFTTERVLNLQNISHNAEYYAAGRLLRTEDGKQKRLSGPPQLLEEIRREGGKPVLVIVPLADLKQLSDSGLVNMEMIKENGELAIIYVSAK